jgi:hypothetical protein
MKCKDAVMLITTGKVFGGTIKVDAKSLPEERL